MGTETKAKKKMRRGREGGIGDGTWEAEKRQSCRKKGQEKGKYRREGARQVRPTSASSGPAKLSQCCT